MKYFSIEAGRLVVIRGCMYVPNLILPNLISRKLYYLNNTVLVNHLNTVTIH